MTYPNDQGNPAGAIPTYNTNTPASPANTNLAKVGGADIALGETAAAASLPVTIATNDAQFGTDGTGIAQPTGGTGIRGWLSGLYALLKSAIGTSGTAATGVITVQGSSPEDSPTTDNPVITGGIVRTAALASPLVSGDAARQLYASTGAAVVCLNAVTETYWSTTSDNTPIITNTPVQIKASAGAGLRNYVTGLQLFNNDATGTVVEIIDVASSAILWAGYLFPTTSPPTPVDMMINLQTPLRGSPNSAINIQCLTTGAMVYWNAQGFVAP